MKIFRRIYRLFFGLKTLLVILVSLVVLSFLFGVLLTNAEGGNLFVSFFEVLLYILTNKAASIGNAGTLQGDLIRGLISIASLLFTGFVIAWITSIFFDRILRRFSGMEIPQLSNHTLICGWNETGNLIVSNMIEESPDSPIVVVCERSSRPINRENAYWINGDFTKPEVLRKAHAHRCESAIVLSDLESVGNNDKIADWQTILAVLAIENINSKIHTAAELINNSNRVHLEHAGVDEIIIRGEFSGNILSRVSQNRGLSKVISTMLNVGDGAELYKIKCPENYKKSSYGEIHNKLYKEKFTSLIGYETKDGQIFLSPSGNVILDEADHLYVLSDEKPLL